MNKHLYRASLLSLALSSALGASLAHAAERSWAYTYTSQGLIESADGPRTDVSDITRYAYDAQGHLTSVTNALGHVTTLSNFDALGHPQTVVDANNVSSTLTYAPQGWLASISTAGSVTTFAHNAVGDITKVTRGDGSSLTYTWDDARRLTAITNNLGETVEYSLDAMGNRTAQRLKDASNNLTKQNTWVYDELGRLLKSVGAGNQTRKQAYDLNDNPTLSTDPLNHNSSQAYDALNRVVQNTDPLSGITRYQYDGQDNLIQVKDPRNVTTNYQYDGLGNLTQLSSPDSGVSTYVHDAAGNVTQKTDARGVVTNYQYDALNRLTSRTYPAKPALNVTYAYDMSTGGNFGIGRLTAIQDASGMLAYQYDAHGNLVEQLRSVEVSALNRYDSLKYAYDGANQLVRIDYPAGFSTHYLRNTAGQVNQVQFSVGSGNPITVAGNISYLPFGPLKGLTWANGASLNRVYDQDYRLSQQSIGPWQSAYQYDANSNITQHSNSLFGQLDYRYDALNRLTEEKNAQLQRSYNYDAVGNRTDKTTTTLGATPTTQHQVYEYASNSNRLIADGAQAITTDAAGNLTTDHPSRQLNYDEQGRLLSVFIGGSLAASYRYNALGQRTHKITSQGTTTFLYGPNGQMLGETQYNTGGLKVSSQPIIWLDDLPLAGLNVSYSAEGAVTQITPFYLHSDHLNTPRLATSQDQRIIWGWQSDAFGVGNADSDPDHDGIQTVINLRFPGQYYDAESGLHYNYFRDYDPQTGRYVESDPIGLDGGLNTYGYVYGNPLKYIDPTGRNVFVIPGAEAGAAAGTFVCPGVGTAVGGAIGAGVGAGLGWYLGNKLFNESSGDDSSSDANPDKPYPNNPDTDKGKFDNIKGTGAKINPDDGSVWERDTSSHGGDQWKRWPDKKSWEKGKTPNSVWPDGRVRK
jgi:RHS repeat-associated protein